jgi:hypothetical protein
MFTVTQFLRVRANIHAVLEDYQHADYIHENSYPSGFVLL